MRDWTWPAAAAIGLLATGAPARADALQEQLLAQARATRADAYAFRRTIAIERTGEPRKLVVEQFDPRRPAADAWTLVGVDGRPPTAKETADARARRREPVPSYARLAEWIGTSAERDEPAPGIVRYRYARLPAGVLKLGPHDASADTRAEALVATNGRVPYVERVRLVLAKGFRMMLVASLKTMTVDARYSPLPDGGVVPAGAVTEIAGSMMGRTGQLRTTVTYSDFQKVR